MYDHLYDLSLSLPPPPPLSLSHSAFFVIITPIDQYKLYCTSVTITDVFNNSSPFCIISGMLLSLLLCEAKNETVCIYYLRSSVPLSSNEYYTMVVLSCLFYIL